MPTLTELFTNIANAIRSAKGSTDTIKATDFPTEIESLNQATTKADFDNLIAGSYSGTVKTDAKTFRQYAFYNNAKIKVIDASSVTSINNRAVGGCYKLHTIIIRHTISICTLSDSSFLTGIYRFTGTVNSTYNPNGYTDGLIFLPSSIMPQYQGATNWSKYSAQFRKLEEFTVDGTRTGELDAAKVQAERDRINGVA